MHMGRQQLHKHTQCISHQIQNIYEFSMQSFKHLLDLTHNSVFQGLSTMNLSQHFSIYCSHHLQGESERRRNGSYGSCCGWKGRGAFNPTVKPMISPPSSSTTFILKPVTATCTKTMEEIQHIIWTHSEDWSVTSDMCCQNIRTIIQWTVFYFPHSFVDVFIQLDVTGK